MIGELLGEDNSFVTEILHHYAALCVMRPGANGEVITFLEAQREFSGKFFVPVEGQKIGRLMSVFAEEYCKHHPGEFQDTSSAEIFAFSIN